MIFDSILKTVRGIVKLRGGTDNTVVGNIGNRLLTSTVSEINPYGGLYDAFGRLRISNPFTVFDSKLINNNQSIFWDELLVSGASITSSYNQNTASVTLTSTASTAGKFVRRTYMRFYYQPGKSQMIMMTGVIRNSGGGTGVKSRIGLFDDNNGLFFELSGTTMGVVKRSFTTGSAVDTRVDQSSWNIDKMDGTGTSGITIDWTKAQIFLIDFEWLGVGRVRFGLILGGKIYYVHEILNSNSVTDVYMSTPNLPLSYVLETTSASPASSLKCICSTVISEGGSEETGLLRYHANTDHINAKAADTFYAIMGLRLKTTTLGTIVYPQAVNILAETTTNFEYRLLLNPTVAGTFTYSDLTNSNLQLAQGDQAGNPSANNITNLGIQIGGGFGSATNKAGGSVKFTSNTPLRLGVSINGTRDTLVLAVRGLVANGDFLGGMSWREV